MWLYADSGRPTGGQWPVTLYRDDGVVLRMQKLGEADRIVTLLTRRTAGCGRWPRGCGAPARVRRRLEPFSHVDLQLYEGRQPRHRHPGRDARRRTAALVADYARYTAGTAIARDRRAADRRGARAVAAAVPAAGRRRCARWPGASTTRAGARRVLSCGPWPRRLRAGARRVRPLRRAGPHRAFAVPAGGVVCAATAGRPARPAPSPESLGPAGGAARRRLAGRRRERPTARREASGLVAAYLQWHLERGLRSLPLVERT